MSDLHTEAAIWAEGTPYTADDLIKGYCDWIESAEEEAGFEWWCENVMKIPNIPEVSDG